MAGEAGAEGGEWEMKWIIFVTVYVACGIVSYGLVYHYYANRFKCFGWPARWWHRTAAIAAAVCGPVGFLHRLALGWDDTDKTEWRLRYRTVTPEESWGDYHQRWPSLSKQRWASHSMF